jgi:hypothetical protein
LILARQPLNAAIVGFAVAASLWFLAQDAAAQGSCRSVCWQAYGNCYKATNSRPRCQSLLKRCLDQCIRSKRGKRSAIR